MTFGGTLDTALELFAASQEWRAYCGTKIAPYIRGHVLEVGAGIGSNTRALCDPGRHRWICLEPHLSLAARLRETASAPDLTRVTSIVIGTTASLRPAPRFDTILYLDVLEHIDDDRAELERATALLRPGGHLIALVPAHPLLYSAFDRALGHYRRYSRNGLLALAPPTLAVRRAGYLDAVGLAASLANRIFLRRALPARWQVDVWDGLMPVSRRIDRLLGFTCGKSVLAIWTRTHA